MVDVLARNYNPTGTIKAGVRARGIEVGAPRRPGHAVSSADRQRLEQLVATIRQAEKDVEALLAAKGAGDGRAPIS